MKLVRLAAVAVLLAAAACVSPTSPVLDVADSSAAMDGNGFSGGGTK